MDMRRRIAVRGIRFKMPDPSVFGIIFLAFCFLAGAFGGYLCSSLCDPASRDALTEYLEDYCTLLGAGQISVPLRRCVPAYLGYTTVVFLLSFSPLGIILIPAAACVLGFRTMYTVSCFVLAFGRPGIIPALAVMVVRLAFILPCFFCLADEAWPLSARLALLSIGRGAHCEPAVYRGRYFLVFFFCVSLLFIGVCCERYLTPRLFRAAVERLI